MTVRPYNPQNAPDDPDALKVHRDQEARAVQQSIKSAKDTTDKLISDATALTTRVTTAEGNITTLNGQMTTANTNIGTLQTTVGELSGRNRIINGDFRVDQRFSYALGSVATASTYLCDRWYGSATGATTNFQIVTVSGQKRFQWTGIAGNTGTVLAQRIEVLNSADLAGKSVTIQVKASAVGVTSLGWSLAYATAADNFASVTAISSGSWTINSTEALYTATVSVPSAAITGLQLSLTTGAIVASQSVAFGDVQLEYGTIATQYERLMVQQQMQLCQRYYQQDTVYSVWPSPNTGGYSMSFDRTFKTTMRAIPTITRSYPTYSNVTAFGLYYTSVHAFADYCQATAAGGTSFTLVYTASAEL